MQVPFVGKEHGDTGSVQVISVSVKGWLRVGRHVVTRSAVASTVRSGRRKHIGKPRLSSHRSWIEIKRVSCQVTIQDARKDTHIGVIVQWDPGMWGEDEDANTVPLFDFCNVQVTNALLATELRFGWSYLIMYGADIDAKEK